MKGFLIDDAHCNRANNSPRILFLQDFYKAIYQGETGFIAFHLHDSIRWEFPGITFEADVNGCIHYLEKFHSDKINQMTLTKIITHGKEAAVTGTITTIADITYQFCDVFTFNSAGGSIIKTITTFQK